MNQPKTNQVFAPQSSADGAEAAVWWDDRSGRLNAGDAQWLLGHLRRAAEHLGVRGEIRVASVGDADMSAAHDRYMSDPTTTDVLTFDLRESAEGPLDTDILVCVDEAERQARERGHEVRRELLLYAVHGVLHCLGHDDHEEGAYETMHGAEDAVLEAIGVGATFRTPPGAAGSEGPGSPEARA